jgi:tetratricopeptide (TPR) repeat protein
MGKYLATGTPDGLAQAEGAFRRALDLNPDLTLTHKLFAQLEVDLGRAYDAMVRLIERAQTADPELLAGLVSACRYCGLLDASGAAHWRARDLEPTIRTSVGHTWFLQADYPRVVTVNPSEYPYIVPIAMAEIGRTDEALALLRELEHKIPPRIRDFIVAARTLLEGKREESHAAIDRVVASDFRDPEGLFYLSRHLAHLQAAGPALDLLERVVDGGFSCFPAMARDPWLDPLRKKPAFSKLLRRAETRHRDAVAAFERFGGAKILHVARPS